MFDIILRIVCHCVLSGWNLHSFYKKRNIYNLLFCIFFAFELLRELFLEEYLISDTRTVIMFIQGVVFIIAIILFLRNKINEDKKQYSENTN
ncbi:hypothetical protein [Clostridium beijerinckii]|uniref:Prolipoprotein diacylglyceryl transferase n=1 Tax=Clostridium beijerinckii TaxID=1520 RepID=A0AAW3WDP1_CLOBE|nr:hypothetical protein [Clostridium beijerinckii]MBC2459065.1 hypothetical protein [Clostridium beijerinckii]MBC2476568.1 hypothetical protein [Clostridium beijerinckii]NOV59566.1 hypothetical protein [Clostridium beijerinckii]NOV72720.1 hypothetical protein [Clostridium beijerinckii]NOW34578.1 hypothetical protein [Clostridium beijerinckii]